MDNNQFSLSSKAEQDMRDIWLYIAQDSIAAAEKFADELEEAFLMLSNYNSIGSLRPHLIDLPVRF